MLSLFRSRVASRALTASFQLPSTSSVLTRSFLTHYTESEVMEAEDMVLNDHSSSSSSSSSHYSPSSSSSHSSAASTSGVSASLFRSARAAEPADSVKAELRADDFNGADTTQRVLDTAGFTHSHLMQRVYDKSSTAQH